MDHLPDDPKLARRVLGMGAAEATERLGSFSYKATVRFQWSAPSTLSLSEERSLTAGVGGVKGDFHAVIDNSRDQGLEVLRSEGRIFAKSRYGTLRERKRDRGMAERAREETFGSLRDVSALFGGNMKLEPRGQVSYEGRSALRFVVSLANPGTPPPASAATSSLPPPVSPKGAANDESTQRRLSFFERRQPVSLNGELWIDAESAVVVRAKLDGTLKVPPGAVATKEATVQVTLDSEISEVGKVGKIPPPEHFIPDADKPPGIAEALERFGIRSRDAGVATEDDDDAS